MMRLLTEKITQAELQEMSRRVFGNLVKAVVDVEKNLLVLDAELHSDEEGYLLDRGSRQQDVWGINLYPEFPVGDENFVEFDSMINLRPLENNHSRSVDDPAIREKILKIVRDWIA